MRLMFLAVSVVPLAMLAFPVPADPIKIKFSHVVAESTPKGRGALKFKELAEAALPGKVVIEVYPNSQLFKDKEEMEALQLGAVQILAPSLAKFGPLGVRDFELFDLPFIFADKNALRRVTDGPVGARLFEKLESKGIRGLAYWDNGFKIMSANKPLRKPEDMRGLKVRIQSSKVLEAQMRAVGALPAVMAFSEVYQALQTGVVDGTENPPSNMFTQKMHEVQKYATMTNHGYLGYAVIVNRKFWDGLPQDLRTGLDKAMVEATRLANDYAEKDNNDAIAGMKASGKTEFIELSADERQAWITAMMPVRKEVASRIDQTLVDAVYATVK